MSASNDAWLAVTVYPAADRRDAVIEALFELGAPGLQEAGDQLLTQFPPGTPREPIIARIAQADPTAMTAMADVVPEDWSVRWRDRVGVHDLGAITIAPPWLADGLDPARTVVVDPGMAFGTGEHATTRGVLRLLPNVLRAGDTVADLGAGSAALAIAAAKLGAGRVAAIENDPDAIGNAEDNVRVNAVDSLVRVIEGDAAVLLPLVAPVRVVLANIISSVLTALLPVIASSVTSDGEAILSGILLEERDAMLQVINAGGWRVTAEDHEENWWSVAIARA